jgi:hypothetical protein
MSTPRIPNQPQQQARPGGESIWYCPARDITVLTPFMVHQALVWWEDEDGVYRKWMSFLLKDNLTDACICQVAEALASFMSEDMLMSNRTLDECIKESGLEDAPPTARILVTAMLGEILLGAYWDTIRSATSAKDGEELRIVQSDPEKLAESANRVVEYLRRTPKQKAWDKRFRHVRTWFRSAKSRILGRG